MDPTTSSGGTHPVEHLRQYLVAGLKVRYALYGLCAITLILFPSIALKIGGITPYAPIYLLFLVLTGWIPILFRDSRHLWIAIYLTGLGDAGGIVFLTINSGGIHSLAVMNFPVLSFAFGMCFSGLLAYFPALFIPVACTAFYGIMTGALPGYLEWVSTVWAVVLDVICVFSVTLYRKREDIQKVRYHKMALVDELTGLPNYRAFWNNITHEFMTIH